MTNYKTIRDSLTKAGRLTETEINQLIIDLETVPCAIQECKKRISELCDIYTAAVKKLIEGTDVHDPIKERF